MVATDVRVVGDTVRELLSKGRVHEAIDLLIAQGHGYHVTVGAVSTGIAGGGGGTIIDEDQPEALISIGPNQAMIPVSVRVQCETPLLAADDDEAEILLAVDRLTSAAAMDPSGGTRESVFNMRTDLGNGLSGEIEAWSAITANLTAPTLGIELAREIIVADSQTAAGVLWGKLSMVYEPKHPPIIMGVNGGAGGAAMYAYWGGTVAVNGYAQIEVVVFPAAWAKPE